MSNKYNYTIFQCTGLSSSKNLGRQIGKYKIIHNITIRASEGVIYEEPVV